MSVDTSVLAAILLDEPDRARFQTWLERAACIIGAPTLVELYQVVSTRRGEEEALAAIKALIAQPNVTVVPFDEDHFLLAADAFRRFGKGRDHPARLNFGDCLAYAVARRAAAPLLYKGGDFGHTDLASAPGSAP
ncbi:type II toxin-antitoxin system VapC family toxin [Salinarimonas rosea]|uniref:type II toxin-antitoxin system VapC family toxin n=1 Tax=Salinarimonas rosea TaxID=552063 RepID=UPI00048E956F|nr:type II toxin-antitoxin system VapC family toxin [Salinarimonas rosea]